MTQTVGLFPRWKRGRWYYDGLDICRVTMGLQICQSRLLILKIGRVHLSNQLWGCRQQADLLGNPPAEKAKHIVVYPAEVEEFIRAGTDCKYWGPKSIPPPLMPRAGQPMPHEWSGLNLYWTERLSPDRDNWG